jgi:hypothetical protein
MGTTEQMTTISMPVAADSSALQYHFMKNSSGEAAVAGDGENAIGVLQNDPDTAGQAGTIAISGRVKVISNGNLAVDQRVAVDTNGHAVIAASNDYVMGVNVEEGEAGQAMEIILDKNGIEP